MRTHLFTLLLWTALTLLGWALYVLAGRADTQPGVSSPAFIKYASNVIQLLCLPAWFLARLFTRHTLQGFWTAPAAIGFGWACWIVVFLLVMRIRSLLLAKHESAPVNLARRRLLVDGAFASAGAAAGGSGIAGVAVTPWALRTETYTSGIAGLHASLDGLRIGIISDTHLGARIPASFIASAVERALALNADVYLLLGDYLHNDVRLIPSAAKLFEPLSATGKPVLSVLGNHDWYADGRAMSQALREVGIETIDNAARIFDGVTRKLTDSPSDAALVFAGVGDLEMDEVSFAKALGTTSSNLPRILLSHQPDVAESPALKLAQYRVDLMISGHTHGGQVKLPFLGAPYVPSRFGTKYVEGIVQGPFCPVLISRGVGTSIVPVRFNVPPEVVELTLVRS